MCHARVENLLQKQQRLGPKTTLCMHYEGCMQFGEVFSRKMRDLARASSMPPSDGAQAFVVFVWDVTPLHAT